MTEPQRVVVCPAAELPPGAVRRVESGGRVACVANVDGAVYAIDDRCLHKQASLSEGRLEGDTIVCPSHWWRYSMVDGSLQDGSTSLASFTAEVVDGEVVVVLPPPVPKRSMREILLAAARGEET